IRTRPTRSYFSRMSLAYPGASTASTVLRSRPRSGITICRVRVTRNSTHGSMPST
ncbi:hypothetical protein IWQ60_011790, partial [Tieghemiomyces parasiticus]